MADKPVLHRRDHEHGGADPVRILWESTGEAGAGGGIQFDTTPQEGGFLQISTAEDGGYIEIQNYGTAGFIIEHNATSGVLRIHSATNIVLSADGGIQIAGGGTGNDIGGDTTFDLQFGHLITILDLPTTAPAGAHHLWNDAGTVKIT